MIRRFVIPFLILKLYNFNFVSGNICYLKVLLALKIDFKKRVSLF